MNECTTYAPKLARSAMAPDTARGYRRHGKKRDDKREEQGGEARDEKWSESRIRETTTATKQGGEVSAPSQRRHNKKEEPYNLQ